VSEVEEVGNLTGAIQRNDSEDVSSVTRELPNIGCYREVLAFQSDSDGHLPVRASITFDDQECSGQDLDLLAIGSYAV